MSQATTPSSLQGDDLPTVVEALRSVRRRWREAHRRGDDGRELPSRELLAAMVQCLSGALFPMRLGRPRCGRRTRTSTSGTPSVRPW